MKAFKIRPFGVAGGALAALMFTFAVTAQQSSVPPLPDPGTLSASWWDYFGAEGEELSTRARNFEKRLNDVESA